MPIMFEKLASSCRSQKSKKKNELFLPTAQWRLSFQVVKVVQRTILVLFVHSLSVSEKTKLPLMNEFEETVA